MSKPEGKLWSFCKGNKITLNQLAKASGLGMSAVYKLNRKPTRNVPVSMIEALYQGGIALGVNLTPDVYLNYEVFNQYIKNI